MGMGSNSLSQLPDYYGRAQQDASADLGSISKIAGLYQKGLNIGNQQDQLQRRNQARDRFGQAWSSGDPNQVEAAMQAFPEFAKQAQEMIGLRDNQHRMDVGSMALQLDGLLQSGDMDSVKAFLQQNAHLLPKDGAFSAQGLISKLDNDDEKGTFRNWLNKYAQSMSIAALKPREIANWGTQQQRLAQQAQRIANQFQLGQERNATQQQRIQSSDHWRGVAHEDRVARANQPTADEKNWRFLMSLPPEQRVQFMQVMGKGGAGKVVKGDGAANFDPTSPTAREDATRILANMTSDQVKNGQAAHRIDRNLTTVAGLLNSGKVTPQRAGAIAKALGNGDIGNLSMNANEQRYVNAMKETVNTIQRKESGAAISDAEWADALSRYLPSVGDSPALAKQKIGQLRGYRDEMIAGAGGAYPAFKYAIDSPGNVPSKNDGPPEDVEKLMAKYGGK